MDVLAVVGVGGGFGGFGKVADSDILEHINGLRLTQSNLRRDLLLRRARQVTPSQRAMVAARARSYYDRAAKERQREGQERGRKSQAGALVAKIPPTDIGKARAPLTHLVGKTGPGR